jgi:hypothetical protein
MTDDRKSVRRLALGVKPLKALRFKNEYRTSDPGE